MRFKLLFGDCLERMKKFPDEHFDLILTDPPFNIDYYSFRQTHEPILNDSMSWIEFEKFMQPIINECYRTLKNDSIAYFFAGTTSSFANFFNYLNRAGFQIKSQLVWVKNNFGVGYYYRPQHECIFACFKGSPPKPKKPISTVLFFDKIPLGKVFHPHQKPVGLLAKLICGFVPVDSLVLDPFMGSGSTGVACLRFKRRFVGIELDKKYFDVAKARIENEAKQTKLILV